MEGIAATRPFQSFLCFYVRDIELICLLRDRQMLPLQILRVHRKVRWQSSSPMAARRFVFWLKLRWWLFWVLAFQFKRVGSNVGMTQSYNHFRESNLFMSFLCLMSSTTLPNTCTLHWRGNCNTQPRCSETPSMETFGGQHLINQHVALWLNNVESLTLDTPLGD